MIDLLKIGLDHVSFGVASRADLEAALATFDQNTVPHGEIKNMTHPRFKGRVMFL